MTPYQSIARRFRPLSFSSVIGQSPVVETLQNALNMGKTSHAYLFAGSRGTGKTSLARILAKALNCLEPEEKSEPCNRCLSCREIMQGSSLDVIEIDGASNRGIDDIRQLNDNLHLATFQGRYRIYIIDEVHMLTKEAFNALLKTLEEPPDKVKFFLATTEPQRVLSTVLSRCQRFDLRRISEELISKKLHQVSEELAIHVEIETLQLIAELAEGSLRDAETLLDRLLITGTPPITLEQANTILAIPPPRLFGQIDEAFAANQPEQAFSIAQEFFASGFDTHHLIDGLIRHYRNIFCAMCSAKENRRLSINSVRLLARSQEIYTKEQLFFILDFLIHFQSKKTSSSLGRIDMEMIILHILQTHQRVSLNAILSTLAAQESPPIPISPIASMTDLPSSVAPKKSDAPSVNITSTRDETLFRFAAVELNGNLKKS